MGSDLLIKSRSYLREYILPFVIRIPPLNSKFGYAFNKIFIDIKVNNIWYGRNIKTKYAIIQSY